MDYYLDFFVENADNVNGNLNNYNDNFNKIIELVYCALFLCIFFISNLII